MIDLRCGKAEELLPTLSDASIDAVICDPPYPEIARPYGRMTEADWHDMMHVVVRQCRRVLKPHGSAVFILQPNSRKVGSMRAWLFEFQAWCCKEWNMVQDAWWWNDCAMPGGGEGNRRHLLRSSVKACVWIGEPDCHRDRDAVMIDAAQSTKRLNTAATRYLYRSPGCHGINRSKVTDKAQATGEATPFNLLPIGNEKVAGGFGHAAGTPAPLVDWWLRYLTRPGDTVLDPFSGSGTVPLTALKLGRHAIGFDQMPEYVEMSRRRCDAYVAEMPLLTSDH